MEIIELDDKSEKLFFDHVGKDPLLYYWFILDWRLNRSETQILLAVEGERIEGMMLIFSKSVASLRGSREAVAELLKCLNLETAEVNAPKDCGDIVLSKYSAPMQFEIMLMSLERGQENIQILHKPERLSVSDSEGIAKVVREANLEWWDDVTAERVAKSIRDNLWLGIKRDGRLVSVGNVKFNVIGSNIGIVATEEQYRSHGFARSIVSALVVEILNRGTRALIHVLRENKPAIHVYSSVGFRPYMSFFELRRGEIIRDTKR